MKSIRKPIILALLAAVAGLFLCGPAAEAGRAARHKAHRTHHWHRHYHRHFHPHHHKIVVSR